MGNSTPQKKVTLETFGITNTNKKVGVFPPFFRYVFFLKKEAKRITILSVSENGKILADNKVKQGY